MDRRTPPKCTRECGFERTNGARNLDYLPTVAPAMVSLYLPTGKISKDSLQLLLQASLTGGKILRFAICLTLAVITCIVFCRQSKSHDMKLQSEDGEFFIQIKERFADFDCLSESEKLKAAPALIDIVKVQAPAREEFAFQLLKPRLRNLKQFDSAIMIKLDEMKSQTPNPIRRADAEGLLFERQEAEAKKGDKILMSTRYYYCTLLQEAGDFRAAQPQMLEYFDEAQLYAKPEERDMLRLLISAMVCTRKAGMYDAYEEMIPKLQTELRRRQAGKEDTTWLLAFMVAVDLARLNRIPASITVAQSSIDAVRQKDPVVGATQGVDLAADQLAKSGRFDLAQQVWERWLKHLQALHGESVQMQSTVCDNVYCRSYCLI